VHLTRLMKEAQYSEEQKDYVHFGISDKGL